MSIKADLLKELDGLVEKGNQLQESYKLDVESYTSETPEADFRAFFTGGLAALSRIARQQSEYYKQVPQLNAYDLLHFPLSRPRHIPALIGSLTALRQAVDGGLLESLESKLRANVHDDFLKQGETLLKAGYHVAAMVLIGGVLEDHLQKLCTIRNQPWSGKGSLSAYNDVLHGPVYEKPVWRRIQAIGDVRNDAAHGDGAKVKRDDVDDALSYVHKMLADYTS